MPTLTETLTEMATFTVEPTITPTLPEKPTETPTAELDPTTTLVETPTETATSELLTPLPTLTETLTETPTATLTPTAFASPFGPEPPLSLIFTDNFDSSDTTLWTLGAGWSFVASEGGQALQATGDDAVTFVNNNVSDAAAEARFLLPSGLARLSLRQSEAGSYTALKDVSGNIVLYRGGEQMGTALVSPIASSQWRTLRLSSIGDIVRVSIDGVEVIAAQDTVPLPPGTISFAGIGASGLLIDDFGLWVAGQEEGIQPTATSNLTPQTSPLPAEPLPKLISNENFDAYERHSSDWFLGSWAILPSETGKAAEISSSDEFAQFMKGDYFNVAAQGRFLTKGGEVQLSVRRSFTGVYTALLSAERVSLYRWKDELQSIPIPTVPDNQWRTLRISSINDIIRVSVDGVEVITIQDAQPLPSGIITLAAQTVGNTSIFADDLTIWTDETTQDQISSQSNFAFSIQSAPTCGVTIDAGDVGGLQTAITNANNNPGADVICLTKSIYSLTTKIDTAYGAVGLPLVQSEITIVGNGAVIQRNSSVEFRIFGVQSGILTLNNVIVSGGSLTPYDGGAIYSSSSAQIIIENYSRIENSYGRFGGGIAANGNLTIRDSTIRLNTARWYGGGIYIQSPLEITNSSISDNQIVPLGFDGGGIYFFNGSKIQISDSLISNNQASLLTPDGGEGGGLFLDSPSLLVAESFITYSCITSNAAYAVSAIRSLVSDLKAQQNWWGSDSGPAPGSVVTADTSSPLPTEPISCDAPVHYWPQNNGYVEVHPDDVVPVEFTGEYQACIPGSTDIERRRGCALENLQFIIDQIGPLQWKHIVAINLFFEADIILDNSPTNDGKLTGQGLGLCTDNTNTAALPIWESGYPRDCYALQNEFRYAVVEYLFNMCTGAGTRQESTNRCDERGFTDYWAWSNGFYQWDIMAKWQEVSQDQNSQFYGLTLSGYINAVITKYEEQAASELNNFTGYGNCPCSWVNDSNPQRGQPIRDTPDPNDYLASYSYVEYATKYGSHWKIY